MKLAITEFDQYFEELTFDQLLMDKTDNITSCGTNALTFYELISSIRNTPEIMVYLSKKYWRLFFDLNVLKHICVTMLVIILSGLNGLIHIGLILLVLVIKMNIKMSTKKVVLLEMQTN